MHCLEFGEQALEDVFVLELNNNEFLCWNFIENCLIMFGSHSLSLLQII